MAAETELRDKAAAYLKQPYARLVVPESDGTYRGEMLEFPGCVATGDTPAEALQLLEDVTDGWLQSALAHNQPIPEPVENTEFSGRLVLRMPKGLHKKAARLAAREGVSLNQFIVTSLAEQVGERARPTQTSLAVNASIYHVTSVGGLSVTSDNIVGVGAPQVDPRFMPVRLNPTPHHGQWAIIPTSVRQVG